MINHDCNEGVKVRVFGQVWHLLSFERWKQVCEMGFDVMARVKQSSARWINLGRTQNSTIAVLIKCLE